jgi:prephenate dehydratase
MIARVTSRAFGGLRTQRVAFQGELGAYGDEAVVQRWGKRGRACPALSFEDVVDAVASGAVDRGVIPVWNSVVGDVAVGRAVLDLAAAHGIVAVDEIEVAVRHQLLAIPGTTLGDVRLVASHPVALAQCGRFLAAHPEMMAVPVYDTAGAARDLARTRTPGHAAIASRAAGERYGLMVVAADVQDVASNVTRFAVIARADAGGTRW